jgi:hypothetical protein
LDLDHPKLEQSAAGCTALNQLSGIANPFPEKDIPNKQNPAN